MKTNMSKAKATLLGGAALAGLLSTSLSHPVLGTGEP